jgi:hypothetical protein
MTTSNFYRDALKEPAEEIAIDTGNHHVENEAGCVIHLA